VFANSFSSQQQNAARAAKLAVSVICFTLLGVASAAPRASFDACFDLHGRTYGVDPELLRALARTESSLNPRALNSSHEATTGSVDIGLMQINSRWLPKLAQHGISRRDLDDPCTNIEVGAWLVQDLLRRHGNAWEAVGAWNAACTALRGAACQQARTGFAWKVYRNRRAPAPAATRLAAQAAVPQSGLVRTSDQFASLALPATEKVQP